jgi:hypothetical protein
MNFPSERVKGRERGRQEGKKQRRREGKKGMNLELEINEDIKKENQ